VQPYRLASTHMTQGLCVLCTKDNHASEPLAWLVLVELVKKSFKESLDKRRVVYVLCM